MDFFETSIKSRDWCTEHSKIFIEMLLDNLEEKLDKRIPSRKIALYITDENDSITMFGKKFSILEHIGYNPDLPTLQKNLAFSYMVEHYKVMLFAENFAVAKLLCAEMQTINSFFFS